MKTAEPIRIRVDMEPIAQPRQRSRIVQPRDGEPYVQNYTPAKHPVQNYKRCLQVAASRFSGQPLNGAIRCNVLFVFPRPQSRVWKTKPMPREYHTKKPDRDNLDKAVLDALSGVVWTDDSRVCDGRITKVIAAGNEEPHVLITITPL